MIKKSMTYKEATKELDQILKEFEANELDMDNLESKMKHAADLIELCKEKLFRTEVAIEKILQEIEPPG